MRNKLRWLPLSILWLLLLPIAVSAQTTASAILSQLNTDEFPQISGYLNIHDDEGEFVHGLAIQDLVVIEDERQATVSELTEMQPGAQFVVAINLGPTFAIRDSQGNSRFDFLRRALEEWANTRKGSSNDDLSLVTSDGYENVHLKTPNAWLTSLDSYQTDPRTAVPSLDVLARAIDVASDPPSQPGMGRVILLLTPPPDRDGIAALQNLASRATQEGVHVFVWLVSSPAYFTTDGANQLNQLTNQTGGSFFTYSGIEPIPDIENYIKSFRYIYSLSYESQLTTSSPHQVAVQIQTGEVDITTPVLTFDLDVQPPNPIFIAPPLQIIRANRSDMSEALSAKANFSPTDQSLELLIEFPDGFTRPLVRTTLYVDGQIADENTKPPFDQFTWQLNSYSSSGSHVLQVEAMDTLGLSGLSIETPIQITVQQTPQSVITTIAQNGPLLAGLAALLAGSILLLVLIIGGRIRPRAFGARRREQKKVQTDPVTQPVPTQRRIRKWTNRLSWPQRRTTQKASAYLEPLDEEIHGNNGESIPISGRIVTFGTDPSRTSITLKDPSVEEIHARLQRDNQGDFHITDADTIAGTWVNYVPISPESVKLEHGDTIHVGRVGFRFKLGDSKKIPKPMITRQEPPL